MIMPLIQIIACYKWGAWKRWKDYYPTILYVIIGDLSYNVLFSNRLLWMYTFPISHVFADFVHAFISFPCSIILFLTHYPKGYLRESLYILAWTIGFTVLEYIALLQGTFIHYYGWSIFWSAGMYLFIFILTKLHTKHPLITWAISAGFAMLTMLIFGQPLLGTK